MAEQKTYSIKIDGIEQATKNVESLGTNITKTDNAWKETQKALKAVKAEMAGLDKNSQQWQDLAKVAGDYKDRLDDINQATKRFASDTKGLDDAINIGQTMVSTFTLAKGAMSAFGLETEGAVEAIQKLQGAMAIIQSLQSLQNTLKGSTAATDLLTKSMKLLGIGMDGVSKTSKVLRLSLASIGIGLIIMLITTLIEYWDDIKKKFKETFPILETLSKKFNGLSGIIKGVGQAIVHWLTNPIVTFAKVIKKIFQGDFKGAIDEAVNGLKNQFTGLKDAFMKGVEDSRQKVETESEEAGKAVVKNAQKTAKEVKDIRDKMIKDLYKAEQKALEDLEREKEKAAQEEQKRLERLKKLKDKNADAEKEYQKQLLKLELQNATTDEEKLKVKQKIIEFDQKIAEEEKKIAAADAMKISVDELEKRLNTTEGAYARLNEEQQQVLQTLITQLSTIKMGAEEAKNALKDTGGGGKKKDKEDSLTDKWHKFIYGTEDGAQDKASAKAQELADAVNTAYQETIGPVFEGVMNLGDAISMAMEFAIEEAEAALEEAETMHDEAVDKVEESKDRLSELNDKMKDSSGAQLEAYKTQMADEMLLLQQREQEEKRLAKEKEKREKELEKQKKKQRKLELQQQLIQAIVSGALAVVNGLATQPFMPVGIAMGALAGVATAIQIATITKQISKLADGGLLNGKSHAQGGIPVGNTGIEVEGGEYIVNKRSTAKYLPLLQQINEEGARRKTVANQIGKYADGGELNYERINSNLDAMNTAKMVSAAISGIEMHPVVSVVDINRGQKDLVEVRQLAGAKD